MPDAVATNPTDSPSPVDGTSTGTEQKPSGAADQASTQDAQLIELQKAIERVANERHSTLDRRINDLTKEKDTLNKRYDELASRFGELNQTTFERQKAEAIEAARLSGDPARLKSTQDHWKVVEDTQSARAELEKITAEIESNKELIERFNEAGKAAKAKELEESTGVSAELILKLFNDQGLTEIEQMEKLAETLKGHVVRPGGQTPPAPLPHPDRVISAGAVKSFEQIEELYGQGKVSRQEYEQAMRERSKI